MAAPVTITQIAEAAGVSTATVDRVLNNRPGVNPATVQRVRQAMAELGGTAPVRGRPRSATSFRFAFVLPAARRGFFDLVDRVVAQSAGEFRHQHITEVTRRLPSQDPSAFADELAHLADMDGIALLAPDTPPVKLAVNELVRGGTHVVTLFSDVAGSMRETFIGADNRAAGRTAGLLLGREMPGALAPGGEGLCALLSPATRYAAEIDRGIGFAQVLQERFPAARLLRVDDMPETDDEACRRVREALAAAALGGARLAGVYNVGPGSHGVHRALAELGQAPLPGLIAHDLLDVHRAMLMSGALSFVLHQDVQYAVSTAARVLRALCEGVRGALAVSSPRVEILTAENLA